MAANENVRQPTDSVVFELIVRGKALQVNNIKLANTRCFSPTVAPNITAGPESITVLQNEMAAFSCLAEGRPPPNIAWLQRAGSELPTEVVEEGDVVIETMQTGARQRFSILTINSAQPRDAIQYICNATNQAGNDNQSATLTVHGT